MTTLKYVVCGGVGLALIATAQLRRPTAQAATCESGCMEPVEAVAAHAGLPSNFQKYCRIYSMPQASSLTRGVSKCSNAAPIALPNTNIQYWNCFTGDWSLCTVLCDNPAEGHLTDSNEATGTMAQGMDQLCAGPINHEQRYCPSDPP